MTAGSATGWTAGRVIACAAGIVLGLLSVGLLAGGVYAACADLGHWHSGSPMMSWLSGELFASAAFVALPAALLILIPIRLAAARDDQEPADRS